MEEDDEWADDEGMASAIFRLGKEAEDDGLGAADSKMMMMGNSSSWREQRPEEGDGVGVGAGFTIPTGPSVLGAGGIRNFAKFGGKSNVFFNTPEHNFANIREELADFTLQEIISLKGTYRTR
uniref:Uncharacterized protein n=2 Tax=Oryza sativa subsp. japonica TaxID=39947 RepID=Q10K89_ORYSJ|nr:hypothetical protein [Oryza sativa Japonica Group]ABF96386.1 hypothetical protein LOC_Os03g27490 [Oryza sativa Japonica Group]